MVVVARLAASGPRVPTRHNDVHVETDQFSSRLIQPIGPIVAMAALEDQVPSFNPSQFMQSTKKNRVPLGRHKGGAEKTNRVGLRGLLRAPRAAKAAALPSM